jgi:hypothetical protein
VKITIEINPNDIEELGDALELADACISNSEYTNREQERKERRAARGAWRVFNRLAAAELKAVKAEGRARAKALKASAA